MNEVVEKNRSNKLSKILGIDKIDYQNKEEVILRDYLALERTKLANERTLFAYIRTSLYLIIAGITMIQLRELGSLEWIGIVSLIISFLIFIFGLWRYLKLKHQLKSYYSNNKAPIESKEVNQTPV